MLQEAVWHSLLGGPTSWVSPWAADAVGRSPRLVHMLQEAVWVSKLAAEHTAKLRRLTLWVRYWAANVTHQSLRSVHMLQDAVWVS